VHGRHHRGALLPAACSTTCACCERNGKLCLQAACTVATPAKNALLAEVDALHAKIPFRINTPLAQAVYQKLTSGTAAPMPTATRPGSEFDPNLFGVPATNNQDLPREEGAGGGAANVAAVVAPVAVLCALIVGGVAAAVFVTKRKRAARLDKAKELQGDPSMMYGAYGGPPSMHTGGTPYTTNGSEGWPTMTRMTSLPTGGPSFMTASSGLPGTTPHNPSEATYGSVSTLAATPVLPCAPTRVHVSHTFLRRVCAYECLSCIHWLLITITHAFLRCERLKMHMHACQYCDFLKVCRKAEMDEHVGKALDHLLQNKLLFAGRYELQQVQRCVGAHGTVQMAHISHSQARPNRHSWPSDEAVPCPTALCAALT
jgi:hypothetical protein